MCTSHPQKSLPTKFLVLLTAASLIAIGSARVMAAESSLDEGKILALLNTINQSEIDAAQEAAKKSTDSEVQNFAAMMQKEHQNNLEKTQQVSQKINVAPDEKAKAVEDQKEKGQQELSRLTPLDGDKFAKAYIDAMVKDHTDALNMIDREMIKAARHEDLKTHLNETREHVASHLDQAKQIKKNLGA